MRLNQVPEEGFTPEALVQRAELLRRSADLLCDKESRDKYESALLGGATGLEFSSNREVAGLILLWEAGNALEAFKLVRKALQPPQAPALGSGRESDLTLLAALSCKDSALQEQEQRHYSFAAELLEEGIHLLQRMGKLPEHRKNLEKELEALIPYRILDLLSRDLSDQKSHQEGLNLLDSFVLKRGGLEGKKLSGSNSELKQTDFELFFQQIRKFLTVQEQIDLFSHWNKNGSIDAGFLYAISLVASGFYRRKPQALQKARRKIKRLGLEGFDSMPLLGCIDLLLADVKQAELCFNQSSDKGLKEWFNTYPGEKLAALCDYSRSWLSRDVLPGFRDIEADSVDLEAWFADKDVQDYVEKIEKKGALRIAQAGFSFISGLSQEKPQQVSSANQAQDPSGFVVRESNQKAIGEDYQQRTSQGKKALILKELFPDYAKLFSCFRIPSFNFLQPLFRSTSNNCLLGIFVFLCLLSSGTLIGWMTMRSQLEKDISTQSSLLKELPEPKDSIPSNNLKESFQSRSDTINFKPLTDIRPNQSQIMTLIEAWLKSKADILSGSLNKNLEKVARKELVDIVNNQRKEDELLGHKQVINAKIISLEILNQTDKRIAVRVIISYKDQRVKDSGEILSETSIPSLKVKYILGRRKTLWQLVDFSSGA
ncbi:cell division protein Ftn2 [Prochlorococcus sp. MIT 0602]|uniref:IMS domain-containing protein n=1 Tax=unclassified Prochlorococcus TaxID=2627481 RepID=UPI0005337B21|nr:MULTISPECIES: IMS domain-containing protein [unclassified Prochlorococcus]KGG16281.1 cell division protein Ftn2 [Prochlorococcus sp. MIT 0603]KGG17985.1 cell division protein Ftn2 [Prochlorococcus sp. MIT 0602]